MAITACYLALISYYFYLTIFEVFLFFTKIVIFLNVATTGCRSSLGGSRTKDPQQAAH
jgi:hypothetical protein